MLKLKVKLLSELKLIFSIFNFLLLYLNKFFNSFIPMSFSLVKILPFTKNKFFLPLIVIAGEDNLILLKFVFILLNKYSSFLISKMKSKFSKL